MNNENGAGAVGILLVVIACALISTMLSGCSFKIETLYHGQTPIGLDYKQATHLSDKREVRTIRAND